MPTVGVGPRNNNNNGSGYDNRIRCAQCWRDVRESEFVGNGRAVAVMAAARWRPTSLRRRRGRCSRILPSPRPAFEIIRGYQTNTFDRQADVRMCARASAGRDRPHLAGVRWTTKYNKHINDTGSNRFYYFTF